MNNEHPHLQIRAYGIDGSTQSFAQTESDLAEHALLELHPTLLFAQDEIRIANGHSLVLLASSWVSRIDLMTDRLSVWDFPFVLGALMELPESEFNEGIRAIRGLTEFPGEMQVFLDMKMLGGQRTFLWMQVTAGLPAASLNRIYSLLNEQRLIFGLRNGGVGILNLANLLHFSVHPEPTQAEINSRRVHQGLPRRRFVLSGLQTRRHSESDSHHQLNFVGRHRPPLED